MSFKLIQFSEEHLLPAVELFRQNYQDEMSYSPNLPRRVLDDPTWILENLKTKLDNPGVAVMEGEQLLSYMVTGDMFSWKGQRAAIVLEYCHAAVQTGKTVLYQRMYQYLAREWVDSGVHLHLIGHLAHDALLKDTLFEIGFGGLLAERLRDCSPIPASQDLSIVRSEDISTLVDLHMEHIRFYPQSPIFLLRTVDRESALEDLESHKKNGDVFFIYSENGRPLAYLIAGESASFGEGFLLQKTNTAQIKSAYAKPDTRGSGIGAALLQAGVNWAADAGYERVFVEHETANIFGANFWKKHFTPYMYYAMRYVDSTL